ncbi:hypothetical protein JCM11251_007716 [Rhodosporidiobolus azoricus]
MPKTLPLELRGIIYSKLDLESLRGFRALSYLSRTSSADRALVLPYLLSKIVVYDQQSETYKKWTELTGELRRLGNADKKGENSDEAEEEEEPEEIDGAEPDEDDYDWDAVVDRGAKKLYKLLKARTDLAQLPKEFIFYGGFAGDLTPLVVERFFEVCPNLNSVRFVGMGQPDLYNDYVDDYVERATADNIHIVLCSVNELHKLEHLSLDTSIEDEGEDIQLEEMNAPVFQLKSLELNALVLPSLFNSLVSTSLSSLTRLSIAVHRHPFDLSCLSSLTSLAVVYREGHLAGQTLETAPASLRSVVLRRDHALAGGCLLRRRGWGSSEDDYTDDQDEYERRADARETAREAERAKKATQNSFAALLPHLPSQIISLSLPFYLLLGIHSYDENEFASLVEALAKPKFLPDLVRLDVADQRKEDRSMWEDEMSPAEEEDFNDARKSLREACEKRGVELGEPEMAWDEKRNEGKMMRYF